MSSKRKNNHFNSLQMSDQNQEENNKEEVKQLKSGVVNLGYNYESVVPALLALQLLFNKDIKNFTIDINPSSFQKFDDLVLRVTHEDGTENQFAIQLKHRTTNRDILDAHEEFCGKTHVKSKSFLISSYQQHYHIHKKTIPPKCKLVLFTNAIFSNTENVGDYFVKSVEPPLPVFNGKTFQLQPKNCDENDIFFEKFYFCSTQRNFQKTVDEIKKFFRTKFQSTEQMATCYMRFFQDLHSALYKDTNIDRDNVILVLTRVLLSNYIIACPKTENIADYSLIEKVFNTFDLTILSNTKKEFVAQEWTYNCDLSNPEITLMAKNYKFLEKEKKVEDLDLIPIFKKVLFLHVTEDSECVIASLALLLETLQNHKIKLILVEKEIKKDCFQNWNSFKTLEDLRRVNETLYDNVAQRVKISFQGREFKSLEQLTQAGLQLDHLITADHLFQLKDLIIGEKLQELPKYYISKSLIRSDIPLAAVETLCNDKRVIIHCEGKSEKVKKLLLEEKSLNITITDDQEFCDDSFHHLSFKGETFEWINPKIDPTTPSVFEENLNILSGEPGMGKTTLLTQLAHSCPLNYWVLFVPLPEITFTTEPDELVRQFLKTQLKENPFCDYFIKEKKVLLLFDAINELTIQGVTDALNMITKISQQGYKVWISCTTYLTERLKKTFNRAYSYCIEEWTTEDQQKFITDRLLDKSVDKKTIDKTIEMWFGMEFASPILKTPLTLYILTTRDKVTELEELNISEVFCNFVEGKLRHYRKKVGLTLEDYDLIMEGFMSFHLKGHQTIALKICLEPELVKSLNILPDQRFIKNIETKKDFLEILRIHDNNTFSFTHRSFAKYFSAIWLIENFKNLSDEHKSFIFQSQYDGIRKFFDYEQARGHPLHLAVLDQDLSRVKKHASTYLRDIDGGGRSAFHLAASLGRKHEIYESNDIGNVHYTAESFDKHEEIFMYLLMLKPNIFQKDELFGWNSLQYADASLCLWSLEKLAIEVDSKWIEYSPTFSKNLFSLTCHCAINGYLTLLTNIIDEVGLKLINNLHEKSVLQIAIENNQNEISMFLLKYGIFYTKTDKQNITALHTAASYGNFEVAEKLLLNDEVNVDARDDMKRTPLHLAARIGHMRIVKLLTDKGANIDAVDFEGKTPLHKAAHSGKQEVVRFLIQKGTKVNVKNFSGRTALQRASEAGHLPVVKVLLKHGAKVNIPDNSKTTALHVAAGQGHKDIVEYLIKKGGIVFVENEDEQTPRALAQLNLHEDVVNILSEAERKHDPLHNPNPTSHKAAQDGDLATIEELLKNKNEEINGTDSKQDTMLHKAAYKGHLQVVKCLLDHNADTGLPNEDGRVPLHLACHGGHVDVVKELLNKGQSETRDKYGFTPLARASQKGHLNVMKLFVDAGIDIKSEPQLLHFAAKEGQIDVIKWLVKRGVNIGSKNYNGETCLHVAISRLRNKTALYLIKEHKEIINIVDDDGQTALHLAVARSNKDIVVKLLHSGADSKIRTNNGRTAKDFAKIVEQTEIIEFLNEF